MTAAIYAVYCKKITPKTLALAFFICFAGPFAGKFGRSVLNLIPGKIGHITPYDITLHLKVYTLDVA